MQIDNSGGQVLLYKEEARMPADPDRAGERKKNDGQGNLCRRPEKNDGRVICAGLSQEIN